MMLLLLLGQPSQSSGEFHDVAASGESTFPEVFEAIWEQGCMLLPPKRGPLSLNSCHMSQTHLITLHAFFQFFTK